MSKEDETSYEYVERWRNVGAGRRIPPAPLKGQTKGAIRAPIPRASRQRTRGGKGKSKRGGRA